MEQMIEQVSDWRSAQLRMDREQRMVWNIALAGRISRNGYQYTEAALQTAVPLYEGKPVFLDHAGSSTRPQERSTRDLVGTIINARFEAGRIRGDVRVLDTEAGETFWALVEAPSTAVGMSHVVLVERGPDQDLVEHIRDVVSVDAVVFPATVSFQEAQRGTETETVAPASVPLPLGPVEPVTTEVTLLQERLAHLQGELDRLRPLELAVTRGEACERLIRESRAPRGCITPEFQALLLRLDDDELQRELLTERVRSWRLLGPTAPQSRAREDSSTRWDDGAIVRVLCPRVDGVLVGN